jgi:hypothetical protein
MSGSDEETLPTCPNGHPAVFAGQRFCEVCRMPIGPAEVASEPVVPPPPPPPAFAPLSEPVVAPPPPPPAFAPLSEPVVAGPVGRKGSRSQLPILLGLVVCLVLAAGAAFVVVGHPFGGGATSPSPSTGEVLTSPDVTATATTDVSQIATATPESTPESTVAPTSTATSGLPAGPAKWVAAGSLHAARGSTRLLVLTDGRALVVGDDNFCEPGPAYDSSMATEIWEANKWALTGSLNSPRDDFTAQSLANDQVLVVGGTNVDTISFSSTKIWSSKTGTWSDSGLLATARSFPASALLKDGRVIVIGGEYVKDPVNTTLAGAEVFSPATGKWTKTGLLKVARSSAMAVTLSDGRVLVAGGYTAKSALADSEIWDSATGAWTSVGATPIWGGSILVPLSDGGALLAGGQDSNLKGVTTAYRFDPKTDKWVPSAKMLTAAFDRVAVVLANGKVLVAGGLPGNHKAATAAAEVFDPVTGTWAATAPMPSAREQSKGVLLPDGSVLIAGGDAGYSQPPSTPWCPKSITDTLRYIPAVP